MKSRPRSETNLLDPFQASSDQLLKLRHPLTILAKKIHWNRFDVALTECYCPATGAPPKDIQLLVGLN